MKPSYHSAFRAAAWAVLAALLPAAPLWGGDAPPKSSAPPAARPVVAACTDGSSLRVTLLDEHLELVTPYGTLRVPAADVVRVEAATRLPADVARRVEVAVARLGSDDFKAREAATAELLALGAPAYHALVEVSRGADKEAARRAEAVLARVREAVPEEQLEFRPHDVVYTADSKFTGRLSRSALRVATAQFGEQSLRLCDVRSLGGPVGEEAGLARGDPDPGVLTSFQGAVGRTLAFTVTGPGAAAAPPPGLWGPGALGGGAVWGSDVYTLDSSLALAAVHAGLVRPGQTKVVRVTILGPQGAFSGTTRNGVTSQAYGPFPGAFRFVGAGRAAAVAAPGRGAPANGPPAGTTPAGVGGGVEVFPADQYREGSTPRPAGRR